MYCLVVDIPLALPFGVSRQTDGAAGHDRAPKTLLATKVIITSLVALVFWTAAYLIIEFDLISFREMSKTL